MSSPAVRMDEIEGIPQFEQLKCGDHFIVTLISWGKWIFEKKIVSFVEVSIL